MYFTCTSFTLYLRDRQQDVAVKQTLVTSRHSCRNLTNLENNLGGGESINHKRCMDTFLFNYPRYKHNISSQNIPMFVLYLTTRRILQQRLQWLECEVLSSRSIIYIGCYLQNSRCGLQISVVIQTDCSWSTIRHVCTDCGVCFLVFEKEVPTKIWVRLDLISALSWVRATTSVQQKCDD